MIKLKVNNDGVISSDLSKNKVLRVTDIGRYEMLTSAYKVLFDYANEHHLTYEAPLIEIYKKGMVLWQ